MARQKERSETEALRGIIREQRAQLKHLKKQLAHADKHNKKTLAMAEMVKDPEDFNYATPEAVKEAFTPCPKCYSKLKELDLGTRVLFTCSKESCKYRRTLAKK